VIKRKPIAIVAALLVILTLVAALQLSIAQDSSSEEDAAPEEPQKEVVAAVPAESVTEYEPDPFEPERLRSSTVRVKRVAVVYSDGSIEIRPVN